MTPDALDDLLDRSTPTTRAAAEQDVAAMIADARAEVGRTRRARPIAVASGALALLLVSGAGVAAATDGFSWGPWVQEPIGAVSFTMANGFSCELRFSEYTKGADAAFVGEVNQALEDWYRSADVVAQAEALVPAKLAELAAMEADAPKDPEADMSGLTADERADEIEHRAWASEWLAWDLAVADLELEALKSAGISLPDPRFDRSERVGQIQCTDEEGELYVPGAGS